MRTPTDVIIMVANTLQVTVIVINMMAADVLATQSHPKRKNMRSSDGCTI